MEDTTMTKTAEIALLDRVIAEFGNASYIGPWLKENRDTIVRDISSDYEPRLWMPREGHDEAVRLIALATETADRIVAEAKAKAESELAHARRHVDFLKEDARRTLTNLAGKL
jgi:hypothetical protein